jgi:DNA-binding XRE family transcriptional regulator
MIANDQQLAIVSRQLEELTAWRDRLLQEPSESRFQTQLEVSGIDKMIARLREEIAAYEEARGGRVPAVVTAQVREGSFAEVAATLVRLRVARGLRQEDVARALGKRQPSIARWEAEDYDGYTLKELSRLAEALGCQLNLSFVSANTSEEPSEEHPRPPGP